MKSAVGTARDRIDRIVMFNGTFQTYNGVGSERINSGYPPDTC
jgi:hypothetical protein